MAARVKKLKVYSVAQVARLLDRHPHTVAAMVDFADIPTCRVGKCNVVDEAGLAALRKAFTNRNATELAATA